MGHIVGRTDIQILEEAVGGTFTYDVILDRFNLSLHTPVTRAPLRWYINFVDFALIRMAANGDEDDETARLRAFFWGDLRTAESTLPIGRQNVWGTEPVASPQGCRHEYVEVTLFHFPSLRCRFCDEKKP